MLRFTVTSPVSLRATTRFLTSVNRGKRGWYWFWLLSRPFSGVDGEWGFSRRNSTLWLKRRATVVNNSTRLEKGCAITPMAKPSGHEFAEIGHLGFIWTIVDLLSGISRAIRFRAKWPLFTWNPFRDSGAMACWSNNRFSALYSRRTRTAWRKNLLSLGVSRF